MGDANELNIRKLIGQSKRPVIFKNYINDWHLAKWSLEKWCSAFGDTVLPFRHMKRGVASKTPHWERACNMKLITFRQFLQSANADNEDWMYFDYKYVHEWIPPDNDVSKNITWKKFGFPDLGPKESTLWIGSRDAHTPAHQDTYGCNIVAQLYGAKRWILFPPEAEGLRPSRIPYEESSVYSQLNFYHPESMHPFNGIKDIYSVEICQGDALYVPRGWWHYVVHTSNVGITLNTWLPVEEDDYSRLGESLVRLFVSQMCKDLPTEETQNLLNPNEDDVSEIPFVVSMKQVETSARRCLDRVSMKNGNSSAERGQDNPDSYFNVDTFISDRAHNNIEYVPKINQREFYRLLGKNFDAESAESISERVNVTKVCFVENLINSFCQPDVINIVRENFLKSLKDDCI